MYRLSKPFHITPHNIIVTILNFKSNFPPFSIKIFFWADGRTDGEILPATKPIYLILLLDDGILSNLSPYTS